MSVTMRDVAQHAGVSIKTVSRVINQEGEISDGTRQRVMQIVEHLGYRPNLVARSLVTRRTGIIGLVIPDITNPFFSEITRGVQQVAREAGMSVMICSVDESFELETQAFRSLASQAVDGIVLYSSFVSDAALPTLIDTLPEHIPVVAINTHQDHPRVTRLITDNYAGGTLALEHLIARGHTRIGMLAPLTLNGIIPRRLRAYRDALTRHHIVGDSGWVSTSPPTVSAGYHAALALLTAHPELSALFCYNDLMAIGALRACQQLGRRVPNDVAIVGFDDIQLAEIVTPTLTTVRVDKTRLGQHAMQLLLNRIAKTDQCAHVEQLDVSLIQRESA
jgi:LacI family transcriptional regulator